MVWKLKLIVEDTLEIFEFDTEEEAIAYKNERLDIDSIYGVVEEES